MDDAPKMLPGEWEASVLAAFEALAHAPDTPDVVAAAFEPVLADLFFHRDADRLEELRRIAYRAFTSLSGAGPVSLEVRRLGWHLRHLGEPGFSSSSVIDLLVVCRQRFGMYRGHPRERCSICAEIPTDCWVTQSAG